MVGIGGDKMKPFYIIFSLILVVLIVFFFTLFFGHNRDSIYISELKECVVTFNYDDSHVSEIMSESDSLKIEAIFNNKKLYKDNPSCGFSKNISVTITDVGTFCFARDTCPIVYWQEKNCYFTISEIEQIELYTLLEKYGFYFPCL